MVEVDVEWLCESALSIGSTADARAPGVDKVTARDGRGRLVIPASSLKGRLRHECERIARAFDEFVCEPPRAERMCPLGKRDGGYCVICEIFGSPWRRAAMRIGDGRLAEDSLPVVGSAIPGRPAARPRQFDSQVRASVSISRGRRTAYGERLFFTETSAPNAGFRFGVRMEGDLPSARHRALLLAGLRSISAVGGGRSRGLGWGRIVAWSVDGQTLEESQVSALIEEGGYA